MSKSIGVVLGGGGITGIAWEAGILAGFSSQGVDLSQADRILGTSAGSFVGAELANHYNMENYLKRISDPAMIDEYVKVKPEVYHLWRKAFIDGGSSKEKVNKKMGEIIYSSPSEVSVEERTNIVKKRLTSFEWPNNLEISSVDAKTGKLHLFNNKSGLSLVDAVSASGAVPGVWPHKTFLGTDWIDGGMVSSTNADYLSHCERLIILAPLNQKYGHILSSQEEAERLSHSINVTYIEPDQQSRNIIGENIYDSSKTLEIGEAGFEQGLRLAEKVVEDLIK